MSNVIARSTSAAVDTVKAAAQTTNQALGAPLKAVAPSTPKAQSAAAPMPSTPTTGTWQHPRFDEIRRRQAATTFTNKNVTQIAYNAGAIAVFWFAKGIAEDRIPSLGEMLASIPLSSWGPLALTLALTLNILHALLPLLRPLDDLSDIPLTPAQRSLLGLPESSKRPTPGSTYVTPPRYNSSGRKTPQSGGSNLGSAASRYGAGVCGSGRRGSFGNSLGTPSKVSDNVYPELLSPRAGSPGPADQSSAARRRESPGGVFLNGSPSASPLLQKTLNRRQSYGSPLSNSTYSANPASLSGLGGMGSPSPVSGKASVGLNSKWLYEKGRQSGGARAGLFS